MERVLKPQVTNIHNICYKLLKALISISSENMVKAIITLTVFTFCHADIETQNMSAVAMISGDYLPQGSSSWLAKLRERKNSEVLRKVGWQRNSLYVYEWMGQGTLTERKSQKDITYPFFNVVCEIFYWESKLLLWWFSETTRVISEKDSGVFVSVRWKGSYGANALPFCCSWYCHVSWALLDEEGKEGKKRTATCKTCIAQIHIFTKSVLQRGGKNMNLQVHHLSNTSCQNSVPSLKQ